MPLMLPKQIILPGDEAWKNCHDPQWYRWWCEALRSDATYAGVDVSCDDNLLLKKGGFELRIDDAAVWFEPHDSLVPLRGQHAPNYKHVLVAQYTQLYWAQNRYIGYRPHAFLDWMEYLRLTKQFSYAAAGDHICMRDSQIQYKPDEWPDFIRAATSANWRREKAKQALLDAFGEHAHVAAPIGQYAYWNDAMTSLAAAHIPGANLHSFDRSAVELMGFGVCLISPDIWGTLGGLRPEPQRDYLVLRDDLSDLVDVVRWCYRNRQRCREIGQRAKQFVQASLEPKRLWHYIREGLQAAIQPPETVVNLHQIGLP
jgi:hypothetical protein